MRHSQVPISPADRATRSRSSLSRSLSSASRRSVTSCPIFRNPPAMARVTPSMNTRVPSLRRCQRTSGADPCSRAFGALLLRHAGRPVLGGEGHRHVPADGFRGGPAEHRLRAGDQLVIDPPGSVVRIA